MSDDDRRHALRVPLDVPCLLTMQTQNGQEYPTLLTDISTGGVQLAVAPGISLKTLINIRVSLYGLPKGLNLLESCKGQIVWASDRYCGIRFDQQLNISIEEIVKLVDGATTR